MGDTVSRVDDRARQGTLARLPRRPRSGQRQHGLHGNVEAGHVEGLKHNLGSVFTVLGRVQRRLGEQKVVVLRLRPHVFEDGLLHKFFL